LAPSSRNSWRLRSLRSMLSEIWFRSAMLCA
jgi:hypothetical protein